MIANTPNNRWVIFEPEDLHAMALAFDKTCQTFGPRPSGRDLSNRIAANIVDLARRGERDPERLCALTLHALAEQDFPTH